MDPRTGFDLLKDFQTLAENSRDRGYRFTYDALMEAGRVLAWELYRHCEQNPHKEPIVFSTRPQHHCF